MLIRAWDIASYKYFVEMILLFMCIEIGPWMHRWHNSYVVIVVWDECPAVRAVCVFTAYGTFYFTWCDILHSATPKMLSPLFKYVSVSSPLLWTMDVGASKVKLYLHNSSRKKPRSSTLSFKILSIHPQVSIQILQPVKSLPWLVPLWQSKVSMQQRR